MASLTPTSLPRSGDEGLRTAALLRSGAEHSHCRPVLLCPFEFDVNHFQRSNVPIAVQREDERWIAENVVFGNECVEVEVLERTAKRTPLPNESALFQADACRAVSGFLVRADVGRQLQR